MAAFGPGAVTPTPTRPAGPAATASSSDSSAESHGEQKSPMLMPAGICEPGSVVLTWATSHGPLAVGLGTGIDAQPVAIPSASVAVRSGMPARRAILTGRA